MIEVSVGQEDVPHGALTVNIREEADGAAIDDNRLTD